MSDLIRPTRVGQRVREIYGDTMGWVIGFKGDDEVIVDWDEKCPGIDEQVGNPTVDELEAVPYLRIPAELVAKPWTAPDVNYVRRNDQGKRVVVFNDGHISMSVSSARTYLLSLYTRVWG